MNMQEKKKMSAVDVLQAQGAAQVKSEARESCNEKVEEKLEQLARLPELSEWRGPVLVRLETHTRLHRTQW